MKFKLCTTTPINYVNKKGEQSNRSIIPTVDSDKLFNVSCLDVTELSEKQQDKLTTYLNEYINYLESRPRFSFEDFVEMTYQEDIHDIVKWRTFRYDNMSEQSNGG